MSDDKVGAQNWTFACWQYIEVADEAGDEGYLVCCYDCARELIALRDRPRAVDGRLTVLRLGDVGAADAEFCCDRCGSETPWCSADKRHEAQRKNFDLIYDNTTPDHDTPCEVCGQTPTLPATGMCAVCTFGEADAADWHKE